MAEPTSLDQQMLELSENKPTGCEADINPKEDSVALQLLEIVRTVVDDSESHGLRHLPENTMDDYHDKGQFPAEFERPAEVHEKPSKDAGDAEESHLVLQQDIGSHVSDAVEVKSAEVADALAPDGHVPAEMDEKEAPFEMPLKEEKIQGEFSAPVHPFSFDQFLDGYGSGTEEEQAGFMKDLENFYKSRSLDFKPPKFYGEGLNCLKLWRAVAKLGGYEQVTLCKLWRQVGESFKPPKTCTTVSWTFRIFYEKALLEYEKHKIQTGELQVPPANALEPAGVDNQVGAGQGSGSGRARRDAAARAMQGWHSQRLLGNGEVGDPIIKEKSTLSLLKKDKYFKSHGPIKKRKGSSLERGMKVVRTNDVKPQGDIMVDDVGELADWVKINVRRTKDCFEIYALVPGLLREEVQVQSDPAGRLIITGDPEQPDNPWGVTPFKKIITLPSRIDPHQTSAVVTLHGQLFVRAPFEQSDL